MTAEASGIELPDRELACAPINSEVGQRYLGAMRAGINCALANREILGHYARRVFAHFFPNCDLHLLFDVSHNTCKAEKHAVAGKQRELFVHRKGATRAFGPGHAESARGAARLRSASAHRRQHGNGLIHSGRARQPARRKPSRRRVMGPAARCRATPRSSAGAVGRSSMISRRKGF